MHKKKELIQFFPCFYASFFIGMVALEIGVILPYLMEELSLSYTLAGGIISAFAIGNLISSLANSFIFKKINEKIVAIFFSAVMTICLFMLTVLPSYHFLYVLVAVIGIGRGSINIFVYASANNKDYGNPRYVHLLSVIFSIGALMAPVLTSLLIYAGLGWRQVVYLFVCLSALVPVLLVTYHPMVKMERENSSVSIDKGLYARAENNKSYIKNPGFYVLGFILFFYLGLENCVNGWFVQYFKDMNIMTDSFANMLVSITWFLVIVGRLVSTYLVGKIQKRKLILMHCVGAALFFILLISTKQIHLITVAMIGLGFFFAGIYPSCIASSRKILDGSAAGMSLLMAIASLGGILIPQLIGVVADLMGLVSGILYLIIIMLCMVIFAVVNYYRKFSEY